MESDSRPPFVHFLLPTLRFPFRRRQHSISSINSTSDPVSHRMSSDSSVENVPSISFSNLNRNALTSSNQPKSLMNSGCPSTMTRPCSLPSSHTVRLTRHYPSTLRCIKCSTDLANTTQILSKRFTGRLGQAYLVEPPLPPPFIPTFPPKPRPKAELINTRTARSVNRELLTGMHIVADVSCLVCATVVGWKYLDAREDSQRYKIGKVILEQERVCIGGGWEDEESDNVQGDPWDSNSTPEHEARWLDSGRYFNSDIQFDSEDEEERESLFSGTWDREVVARRRGKTAKKGSDQTPPVKTTS